jgi:FMN-dependent NADH-azoreductase
MKLLHVDSSILAANSVSRQLTRDIVKQWISSYPGTTVEYLDLAANSPNHLSADALPHTQSPEPTLIQVQESMVTDALVSQFLTVCVSVAAPLSAPNRVPKGWLAAGR